MVNLHNASLKWDQPAHPDSIGSSRDLDIARHSPRTFEKIPKNNRVWHHLPNTSLQTYANASVQTRINSFGLSKSFHVFLENLGMNYFHYIYFSPKENFSAASNI